MSVWDVLLPFEAVALIVLSAYLLHLEKRARFLKRQDKRIEVGKDLTQPAGETA